MRDNSNETQVGSCAPAPGSPMICAALYDAARTVGEMDTLLELAKRAAVKAQNWEQAAKLRDAKHMLYGRNRDALLHEETVEANTQAEARRTEPTTRASKTKHNNSK